MNTLSLNFASLFLCDIFSLCRFAPRLKRGTPEPGTLPLNFPYVVIIQYWHKYNSVELDIECLCLEGNTKLT